MKMLHVVGWEKWQSYRRDRGQPPWIKVHRRLAANPEWAGSTDAARGQLVAIWLLAADRDGFVPDDPLLVRRMCMMSSTPDLKRFIELGFLEYDANVTPTRRQLDAPETETETETETEAECGASRRHNRGLGIEALDDIVRLSIYGLYGDGNGITGTDERVWGGMDDHADRRRCLETAVMRWQAEGHDQFRSRLFRRILETVISENRSEQSESAW